MHIYQNESILDKQQKSHYLMNKTIISSLKITREGSVDIYTQTHHPQHNGIR